MRNELENKVIFTGFISQKEVNRIYNRRCCSVTIYVDEPAGLTMVEAMASGFQ
ncbi:MAG: glycosyltransferase [Faecalibacillus faecis]